MDCNAYCCFLFVVMMQGVLGRGIGETPAKCGTRRSLNLVE